MFCDEQGGVYLFQLIDYYAASGSCLMFGSVIHCVVVGWAFGKSYLLLWYALCIVCTASNCGPWLSHRYHQTSLQELIRSVMWLKILQDIDPGLFTNCAGATSPHSSALWVPNHQMKRVVRCVRAPVDAWMMCFFPLKVCFICSFINYQSLISSKGYVYPDWAYSLGWAMALSSVVTVPIYAIVKLCLTKGTLRQVRKTTHLDPNLLSLQPRTNCWA